MSKFANSQYPQLVVKFRHHKIWSLKPGEKLTNDQRVPDRPCRHTVSFEGHHQSGNTRRTAWHLNRALKKPAALCNVEGGDHRTEAGSTWMFNKDILRTSSVFSLQETTLTSSKLGEVI